MKPEVKVKWELAKSAIMNRKELKACMRRDNWHGLLHLFVHVVAISCAAALVVELRTLTSNHA